MDRKAICAVNRRTVIITAIAVAISGCDRNNQNQKQEKPVDQNPKAENILPDRNGLIELIRLDPAILLDIRYATANNFTGRQLYNQARAFLVKPAALALVHAHRALQRQGFGLTIYDAYRPLHVTKSLWDATPPGPKRNYVANPKRGSKHNRGCAVDLTLHVLTTGQEVIMPSGYDEFTQRAHRNYGAAPAEALRHRALLQKVMEDAGFRGASNEWWHFDFIGWQDYPLLDVPFEQVG